MDKSSREQLVYWLFGHPIHNSARDQCCPDFSCCGQKLWDFESRLSFIEACARQDSEAVCKMMKMALPELLLEVINGKDVDVDRYLSEFIKIEGEYAAYIAGC